MEVDLSDEKVAYQVYSKVASDFIGNIFFYAGTFLILYCFIFKFLHWVLLAKVIVVGLIIVAALDIVSTIITVITTIALFFMKETQQHYFSILSTFIRLIGCLLFTGMCYFLIIKIF